MFTLGSKYPVESDRSPDLQIPQKQSRIPASETKIMDQLDKIAWKRQMSLCVQLMLKTLLKLTG